MSHSPKSNHPDLTKLVAFSEDGWSGPEAEEVGRHLASCTQCRLELKCYHRFEVLGEDPLEDAEVHWDQAKLELERNWHQQETQLAVSEALKTESPAAGNQPRRWRISLWLVPAAAAVAGLIFLAPSFYPESDYRPDAPALVRGAEDKSSTQIDLVPPSGDWESLPEQFTWQTDVPCEYFTLEIFTADLKKVLSLTEIESSSWRVTKEAIVELEPATIYLWHVQGFRKLQLVAQSGNNWFRLPKAE